jgi:hypothetical protein
MNRLQPNDVELPGLNLIEKRFAQPVHVRDRLAAQRQALMASIARSEEAERRARRAAHGAPQEQDGGQQQ